MTDVPVEEVAAIEAPQTKRGGFPLPDFLKPNAAVSAVTQTFITIGWIVALLAGWFILSAGEGEASIVRLLPSPGETFAAFLVQWQQGAGSEMLTSLIISIESILWAAFLGLGASYLATMAGFKPPVWLWGYLRFLSLTGVLIFFILATNGDGHRLKVAVLTFAITTFLVAEMMTTIANIPETKFDHARTLGLNRFQVLREVVIRGTLDKALDSLRGNAAMAWMMLTMVEGLSRSEGGIGVLLLNLNRMQNWEAILAIQIMILIVGIGQDTALRFAKSAICPYTRRDKTVA